MRTGGVQDDDTFDLLQRGRFGVLQPRAGHRSGLDALLLAAAVPPDARGTLLDLGAGSGAVAFAALSSAPDLRAVLLERDSASCARAMAALAHEANGHLRGRVLVVRGDVASAPVRRDGFDRVVANPPFNDATHRRSPDAGRAAAHAGDDGLLLEWWRAAAAALRPGGEVAFVVRASSWPVLAGSAPLEERTLGDLRLLPVHPRAGAPAKRVLLLARKGARAAPSILPPLVLHRTDGRFTEEAEAVLNGERSLYRTGAPSPRGPSL